MAANELYTEPREVTDLGECYFYHTMELPGLGTIPGPWDLRQGLSRYLGSVRFAGKRVLDVGAATGCLSFHMENQGAEVVSYDLSDRQSWDLVPYAGTNLTAVNAETRGHIRKLNNAYWYCHRALRSQNRVVNGTVYLIPPEIGPVDIAVFGSVLLHLRDPFLALQRGLQLVRDTAIVADVVPRRRYWRRFLGGLFNPEMLFLPEADEHEHTATWWVLPPQLICRFLGVLGFEDTRVTYHWQKFEGSRRFLYTVVGRRTRPAPLLPPEVMPSPRSAA